MQRYSTHGTALRFGGIGRALTARLALRVLLLGGLMALALACSSGSSQNAATGGDGQTATDDSSGSGDGGGDDDAADGSGNADQGDSTGSSAPTADPDTSGDTGSDTAGAGPAIDGVCGIDEVNRQPFYSVANIDDDDPDGGLNVRDNYENGEKLATLEEGTVVYAEDCFQRTDGAVWYSVATPDDVFGWVNAAYLSPRISSLEPTFGGSETAEKVVRLLDALAARRWEDAADELVLDDDIYVPVADLLGAPAPEGRNQPSEEDDEAEPVGPDVAAQLAAYCSVRVCDGPYTVTDVRGSYVPSRVRAEVDVTFTYSGGIVTQTFGQVGTDGEAFTLDTLPGQSILAFKRNPPSVSDVAGDPDNLPSGLLDAAEAVRRSLLAEEGDPIPDDFLPNEGVVVSVDAYVDPDPALRQIVTAQDLALNGDMERIWGYSDGVGAPIVLTVNEQMASYRRQTSLLEPDIIGVDTRVGLGNTIDNLAVVFPDAHIVEFHRQGRGELADFNWSSIRLALELRDRQWVLVAIAGDSWTI